MGPKKKEKPLADPTPVIEPEPQPVPEPMPEPEVEIKKTRVMELVYQPPSNPALIFGPQANFDCDDICERDFERMLSKMPTYWSPGMQKIGATAMFDVLDHLQQQPLFTFSSIQKLAACEIFFYTLKFFVNTKIANAQETVDFFEEQLMRYAVEHIPKSVEIFDIAECFVVLDLFKDLVLPHLALLRALTSTNSVLKLEVCDPAALEKPAKTKKK